MNVNSVNATVHCPKHVILFFLVFLFCSFSLVVTLPLSTVVATHVYKNSKCNKPLLN